MENQDFGPGFDPIKASYDVYIKPHISEDRQIYILQFPNRDGKQNYTSSTDTTPHRMRLKDTAGMLELDVPINVWANFDRDKGIRWGEAIKKSNSAKGGGSHGLPGGFGIGGAAHSGRGRAKAADEEELNIQSLQRNYGDAVKDGKVLQTQTLGGQFISNEDATPRYMIGVFRKDQLHLTPVDHMIQMRPQFHHIDAQSEQERAARGRDPTSSTGPAPQARAIHMTVKSNIDGEENTTDTMGERITMAQSEHWKGHKYVDEEDPESWQFYEENLFIGSQEQLENSAELKKTMPTLLTSLNNGEYMDTISAPTNPAKLSRSKMIIKGKKNKGKGKEIATENLDSDNSSSPSELQYESEEANEAVTES